MMRIAEALSVSPPQPPTMSSDLVCALLALEAVAWSKADALGTRVCEWITHSIDDDVSKGGTAGAPLFSRLLHSSMMLEVRVRAAALLRHVITTRAETYAAFTQPSQQLVGSRSAPVFLLAAALVAPMHSVAARTADARAAHGRRGGVHADANIADLDASAAYEGQLKQTVRNRSVARCECKSCSQGRGS